MDFRKMLHQEQLGQTDWVIRTFDQQDPEARREKGGQIKGQRGSSDHDP